MAAKRISIDEFLTLSNEHLVIDVRSPAEYQYAHLPSAISMPLFSDEERAIVGTTYKKQSREDAIKIGLDFFGVKMKNMVMTVEDLLNTKSSKTVLVYCWRGGMRSGAVSWLLDMYGFKVYTLEGGYKNFRNWVLNTLSKPYNLRILSGKTGSGKTDILKIMESMDEVVIDLEDLAHHKGSAFGALGMPEQPTSEQFDNVLALKLHAISDSKNLIWLESESSRIGQINIHYIFYNQMKTAPRLHLDIPFEKRLDFIVAHYGLFEIEKLIEAVERIQKRLGGLETKNTIQYLQQNNIKAAFKILLKYYDKYYEKSNSLFHEAFLQIDLAHTNAKQNAEIILNKLHTNNIS